MMTVGLPVKPVDKSLQLIKELIAVDSVNPSLVGGAAGEAAVARTIARSATESLVPTSHPRVSASL